MIAQDCHDREPHGGQLVREAPSLFGHAVIGEISGEKQQVGNVVDLGEKRLQCTLRSAREMKVADGCNAYDVLGHGGVAIH